MQKEQRKGHPFGRPFFGAIFRYYGIMAPFTKASTEREKDAFRLVWPSARTAFNRDHGDRRVRVLLEEVPAGQIDDRIWIRADA